MKKRKISIRAVSSILTMLVCIIAIIYFLYAILLLNGIENMIRIIISIILIVLNIYLIFGFIKSIKQKNNWYILCIVLGIIYTVVLFVFGHYIIKTYKVVDNFTTDSTKYSSSLVTLSDNDIEDISDVTGTVGILEDEDNKVGYILPNEVIEENNLDVKIKQYSSYVDLISALYDEEVDYIFLPTNYSIMFSSYEGKDFSSLDEDTKIVYTKETSEKNTTSSSSSDLTQPFTILLMGVDSEDEDLAGSSFNGDSLMLITFNPNTLNATLLSIPRDSYVPIACYAGKPRSKITHAAWNGESCMIDTIENLTGITIDYYVKINFKGLVKIVDTLGGIDMDIPYSFCEQDSNRKFGNNTIYVKAGFQTLNGEQALAFSRNRHTWPAYCGAEYSNYESNDFIRGQNQQKVLTAILDKIKSNGNLQTIYNLLDVVSNSMETNMSTSEILSLYNIGKDVIAKSSSSSSITDIIGMQRLYLSGKDAYIIDSLTGMNLYFYVLYNESLNDVIDAMKINLELKEPELIKEFSFDVDEEYTSTVIGQMDYGTTINYTASSSTAKVDKEEESSQVKVPNFVGLTYSEAKEKATSLNLYINASGDTEGKVISQDTPKDTLVDTGVTIKLTFGSEQTEEKTEQVKVPDFTGLTYSEAKTKATSLNLYINATGDTEGKVISQDTTKDTLVDTGVTIKLTFEKEETEVEESDE